MLNVPINIESSFVAASRSTCILHHVVPFCTVLHHFAAFWSTLCMLCVCFSFVFCTFLQCGSSWELSLSSSCSSCWALQESKRGSRGGNAATLLESDIGHCHSVSIPMYSHSIPIFFNAFCLTSSWWAVVVRQSSNPFQSFSYLFISLPCFIFAVHSRHSHCMVQVTATGWAETGSFATSARRRTATRAGTCWEPMARYGDMASFWNGDMRQYRHRPSWFIHPCLHCTKTLLRLSGCNSTIPPNFTVSSCRLSRAKRPENLQLLNLLQQQQVRCCLLLDKLGVILLLCNIVRVWIWIML